MDILLLVVLLALSIFICWMSIKMYKKVWNPVFLCSSIIALGAVLCYTQPKYNKEFFVDAFFWISIGVLLFGISFIIGQSFKMKTVHRDTIYYYNLKSLHTLQVLCLVVCVIMLVLKICEITQLGFSIEMILFNASIRSQLIKHEAISVIPNAFSIVLTMFYYWSLAIAPLAVQYKCKNAKKILAIIVAVALFRGIIGLSKEAVLVPVIIVVTSLLANYQNNEELTFIKKYRYWIIAVLLAVIVMSTIQRGYVEQGFYSNTLTATVGTIGRYLSISVYSIATLFNNRITFANGTMCFRPIFNTLSYFGIGEHLTAVQVDYGAGNVYTMFGNMYVDFGYVGIVFLSVLFGLLFGILYDSRTRQKFSHLVTNGIICMVMFMAFYDFQFIESIYVYTIVFAYIMEILFKKYFYVTSENFFETLDKNVKKHRIRFVLGNKRKG